MPNRKIPIELIWVVAACGMGILAATIGTLSENRVLQALGVTVVVGILIGILYSDWIEAALNEWHVKKHPELLRNEPIGYTVAATADFRVTNETATGYVRLNGENWKADCSDGYVPKSGDTLVVVSREGLLLRVRSQDCGD